MDKCSFCIAGICILWWGLSFVQAALLVLQQLLFAAVCDEWSSEAVHLFSIHIYIVQFAGLSLCSQQPHVIMKINLFGDITNGPLCIMIIRDYLAV